MSWLAAAVSAVADPHLDPQTFRASSVAAVARRVVYRWLVGDRRPPTFTSVASAEAAPSVSSNLYVHLPFCESRCPHCPTRRSWCRPRNARPMARHSIASSIVTCSCLTRRRSRRSTSFDRVVTNVRTARARRISLSFVVNRLNRDEIRPFLEFSRTLPVVGTMFYLHTPYYGRDELTLRPGERVEVLDELLRLADAGFPILNSRAALRLLRSGNWRRPTRLSSRFCA